jgi:hypothetical protein
LNTEKIISYAIKTFISNTLLTYRLNLQYLFGWAVRAWKQVPGNVKASGQRRGAGLEILPFSIFLKKYAIM